MLLAAGFGRRMVPLTLRRAKPALPFLNRPLLLRQLDYLSAWGVDEVVVNLHHQPESLLEILRREAAAGASPAGPFHLGKLTVHISLEDQRLGTTGGLKRAAAHFRDHGTFLCLNADMLGEMDIEAALATHRRTGAPATLVLTRPETGFTPVAHDGKRVLSFGGGDVPAHKHCSTGTFTGLHLLEPALLDRLPDGVSEFLPALYLPMIAEGKAPAVHVDDGRWVEVGTAARYLDAQAAALKGKPFARHRPWVDGHADTEIRQACGADIRPGTIWGPGCNLGWGAVLGPGTVLGREVEVGEGAMLEGCVLHDGVRVGPGARLKRVVAGARTEIPAGEDLDNALLQDGDAAINEEAARPARRWKDLWRADF